MQVGFTDITAIGGLSEPVSVAFAGDGTAFIALKTGVIKSFDYNAKTDAVRAARDVDRLRRPVGRGQQLRRPRDDRHRRRPAVPGAARTSTSTTPTTATRTTTRRSCPSGAPRASSTTTARRRPSLADPVMTGCPVMDRVSRLTAQRTPLGWTMVPGQRAPAGRPTAAPSSPATPPATWSSAPTASSTPRPATARASAATDFGQANNPCGDPADEGGSLRAQDQRTTAGRRPARHRRHDLPARPGRSRSPRPRRPPASGWSRWASATRGGSPSGQGQEQLWSVDVGSSNWEEIN